MRCQKHVESGRYGSERRSRSHRPTRRLDSMSDEMQGTPQKTSLRRGFFKMCATSVLAVPFVAPIVAAVRTVLPRGGRSAKPRPSIALSKIPRDEPLTYRLRYEEIQGPYRRQVERLLFLRRTDDGVLALGAECTHAGCNVSWDGERKVFACPCHDGGFDPDGNPAFGPPVDPLRSFRANATGESDVVTIEV